MSQAIDPTEILEQTFELYSEYLSITESAAAGASDVGTPEFYAPPPSAHGLIIR